MKVTFEVEVEDMLAFEFFKAATVSNTSTVKVSTPEPAHLEEAIEEAAEENKPEEKQKETPEEIAARLQMVGGPLNNKPSKRPPKKRPTKPVLTEAEKAALNSESTAPPTKDELKAALMGYEAKHGRPAKVELLARYGAEQDGKVHPRFLDKEKWAAVVEEVKNG